MPGMGPLDPRSFGTWDVKRDMVGLLEACEIRSVSWKGGDLLAFDAVRPGGQKITLEFDQRQSFLPTRTALWNADGKAIAMCTMEYKAAAKDGPLFLKRATTTAFPPGGLKSLPDKATEWFQKTVVEMSDVHVNKPLDESIFEVSLPPGTRVSDAILEKVYEQK